MERDELFRRIVTALSREIDYIVVGGYAWERTVMPAGTVDLDIIVISKDYKETLKKISTALDKAGLHAVLREEDPVMSLFEIKGGHRTLELEVINSNYYSTRKKEFFGYVKQYRSILKKRVRYANPELVWYMRLYLPDWEIYLYKCLRELTLARQAKRYELKLNDTLEIADVFGTGDKMKTRVKVLKKMISKTKA